MKKTFKMAFWRHVDGTGGIAAYDRNSKGRKIGFLSYAKLRDILAVKRGSSHPQFVRTYGADSLDLREERGEVVYLIGRINLRELLKLIPDKLRQLIFPKADIVRYASRRHRKS